MRIFLPTGLFLLIVAAYSAYWLWAADHMEEVVNGWATDQRAQGAEVSWSELRVQGYPFRLEVAIEKPVVETPDWGWRGERFILHMLPYSFSHYIGTFRGEHAVRLGAPGSGRVLAFRGKAQSARASLVLEQDGAARLSVDLKEFFARQTAGAPTASGQQDISAARLQLHVRQSIEERSGGPTGTLAVAVEAEQANWPQHGIDGLGPLIALARGQMLFTSLPVAQRMPDLARYLKTWAAGGGEARLAGLELHWDDMNLAAEGTVAFDALGRPKGRIDTHIGGYATLLDVLKRQQVMKDDQAKTAEQVMSGLNLISRDQQGRLKLPVKMNRGALYLGPVKISRVQPVY